MTEQLADTKEGKWDKWKGRPGNDFIHQVQRGRVGANVGLDNGLVGVNTYINGTHRGRYYLIGADTGVGKTTLCDFMYVFSAWAAAKAIGRAIKIYYCSFEVSKLDKMAKWSAYYIFEKYGIELPVDYIFGRNKDHLLTDEHLAMVKEGYDMVEELMKDVIFYTGNTHPTAIFLGIVNNHYAKAGTIHRLDPRNPKSYIIGYTPNDPDEETLLIVDHMALVDSEKGLSLKGTMDQLSKHFITLKNMFGTTIIAIQQFSTDLLQAKRERAMTAKPSQQERMVAPNRLDFGDSKTLYRDAEVVFGLVKPADFELAKSSDQWELGPTSTGGLGDYYLLLYLMKNRYGPDNKVFSLFANHIAGKFYDLPNSFDDRAVWYDKAQQLDITWRSFSQKRS